MDRNTLKIMIVEDDLNNSSSLKDHLVSWGHEIVHLASDGQNAIEAFELCVPELVVIDAAIGGAVSAFELATTFRKKSEELLIFITSNQENNSLEEWLSCSPNGIITDSSDKHQLKVLLDTAIATKGLWKNKLKKINDELSMASMQIQELTETNTHLITATFRERALKQELEATKLLIEAQAKKIQDSINYAKSIQNSILPKELVLKELFPDSFLLFRPKDIVSGDFPFIYSKDEHVYFAAVDCTGHGVPGALLSLIGSLLIQEIVHYGNPTPAVLLDKLHEAVVKTLRQGQEGGENERDGMDVGMCRLNRNTGELQFSGAHRPLYIVRKDTPTDEELEELKG
ncbi:MAG: response regulator, partial [Crocinitomicaceae bacterium]|nr:response regulator [Crocinitomicaceae bacterium]